MKLPNVRMGLESTLRQVSDYIDKKISQLPDPGEERQPLDEMKAERKTLFFVKAVFGFVCGYVLLISAFALLYLKRSDEFAYSIRSVEDDTLIGTFIRMIYFSTITMTTLGYGDIVPTTSYTRLLVCGQSTMGAILFGFWVTMLFIGAEQFHAREQRIFRRRISCLRPTHDTVAIHRKRNVKKRVSSVQLGHAPRRRKSYR